MVTGMSRIMVRVNNLFFFSNKRDMMFLKNKFNLS